MRASVSMIVASALASVKELQRAPAFGAGGYQQAL